MPAGALPKFVRSAVNRNAQRLALTKAYQALRDELQVRAQELWQQSGATAETVARALDMTTIDYGPRTSLQQACT